MFKSDIILEKSNDHSSAKNNNTNLSNILGQEGTTGHARNVSMFLPESHS